MQSAMWMTISPSSRVANGGEGSQDSPRDTHSAATVKGAGAADAHIPPVDLRSKSLRPKTHERRRSGIVEGHNRPILVASPVVSLPVPTSKDAL